MIRRLISKCSWNQVLFISLENRLNHHCARTILNNRHYSTDSIEIDPDIEFDNDTTKLGDARLSLYPTSTDPLIHKINDMNNFEEISKFLETSLDKLEKEQFIQVIISMS
jgi:hypothetical protein